MGAIELVPKPIWPRSISLNIPKRMMPLVTFPHHHRIEIGSERQFVDTFREEVRDAVFQYMPVDLSRLFHEGKFVRAFYRPDLCHLCVKRLYTGKMQNVYSSGRTGRA